MDVISTVTKRSGNMLTSENDEPGKPTEEKKTTHDLYTPNFKKLEETQLQKSKESLLHRFNEYKKTLDHESSGLSLAQATPEQRRTRLGEICSVLTNLNLKAIKKNPLIASEGSARQTDKIVTNQGEKYQVSGKNTVLEEESETMDTLKQRLKEANMRNDWLRNSKVKELKEAQASVLDLERQLLRLGSDTIDRLNKKERKIKDLKTQHRLQVVGHRKSMRLLREKFEAENEVKRRAVTPAPIWNLLSGSSLSSLEIRSSSVWTAKIRQLEISLRDSEVQLKLARGSVAQSETTISDLKKHIKSLKASVRLWKVKTQTMKYKEKNNSEINQETDNKEVSRLSEKNLWYSNRLKKLKASGMRRETMINSLKSRNATLKQRVQDALMSKEQLRVLREQIKKKEKCNTELRGKLSEARTNDIESTNRLYTIQSEAERKDNVIMNLKLQIDVLDAKVGWNPILETEQVQKLEAKCTKLKSKLLRKERLANLTKTQMGELKKKIDEMMIHSGDWAQKLQQITIEEKKTSESLANMFSILTLFTRDLERKNRSLRKERKRKGGTMMSSLLKRTFSPDPHHNVTKYIDGRRKVDFMRQGPKYSAGRKLRSAASVARAFCPPNVDKDGDALCGYLSRLIEERIGLEVEKKLQYLKS